MKAVLFDLDDTLFDHKHSRLKGLEALQRKFQKLGGVSLEELEEEHERLLGVADYCTVPSGNLVMANATTHGISKLCAMYGVHLSIEEEKNTVDLYNKEYLKNRQSVPGSIELLTTLMNYAKLGVISNGQIDQEMEKLKACKIDKLLDYFIIYENDCYKKPCKQLFEIALEKMDVTPANAVYVGDSWKCDILPAVDVGIKAVWLNRYGLENPNPRVASEIQSFIDVDKSLFL
ncbi:MAG: HAD family hydrolase [Candidatus Bathyarchaeia archaeon]|jgi:putative hydrolase of the HAD superfamily